MLFRSKGDGTHEALMASEESVERLLGLNYSEIEGCEHVLLIKRIPVQFSVIDVFEMLEEQLGEAEDLEAAFPRGGVRARVVTSEVPQIGPPSKWFRGGGPGRWPSPNSGVPPTFQCYRCGGYGHKYKDCMNEPCKWPEGKGKGKGKVKGKGNVSPRGQETAGGAGDEQNPLPPSHHPRRAAHRQGVSSSPMHSTRGARRALGGRVPLWLAVSHM